MKRRHKVYSGIIIAVIACGAYGVVQYLAIDEPRLTPGEVQVVDVDEQVEQQPEEESETQVETIEEEFEYTVESVADGLEVPWSVVFTSQNRLLVSERTGTIRVVENGELLEEPLYTFENISTQSEEGLMGLALDPTYTENAYVYACYAYPKNGGLVDRVVRLEDTGDALISETIILDDIPAARFHAGCRLGFGPDEKLYITTGDATDANIAQDLNSLGGKILRINADGSIPADNPFENSAVYSYGHRNAQGISWHPESEALLSTEHGPSGFDGPGGGDEVNRIEAGANYGWPEVSHDETGEGFTDPLIQFTPAEAPGSALVYSGNQYPVWYGQLFFGALVGEGIIRVEFTNENAETIAEFEKLDIAVGRVREVTQGPDGYMYFTTSNRDGRGDVRAGDDHIYRIIPANTQ